MNKKPKKGHYRFVIKEELPDKFLGDLNAELLVELRIECSRLQRHLHYLSNRYVDAGGRDLAVVLRNIKDLANVIDNYCKENDLKLQFYKSTQPNTSKQILRSGDSTSHYFDEPLIRNNGKMAISDVSIIERALTQEQVKQRYEQNKSAKPILIKYTLQEWLAQDIFEYTFIATNKTVKIQRGKLIDRVANSLGGAHPATLYTKAEAAKASAYNVELDNIIQASISNSETYGDMPMVYAHLFTTGHAILKAFKVFFKSDGYY